jgi:hypothetical protein
LDAEREREQRARALQARICGLLPPIPASPEKLFSELRKSLRDAIDEGKLKTKPHEIFKMLKKSSTSKGEVEIVGGEKNFHRTLDKAHFTRADGAWFDFAITVARASDGKSLILLAYDFEIRFPEHIKPAFVRFDLNQPGHENEIIGLRSHLHPGSDDLSVPSPLMSPLEILDVLLHGLVLPEKARASSS